MYYYQDFNDQNLFQYFNGWYSGILKKFHKEREGSKIDDIDSTTKGYIKIRKDFESILVHANYIILNLRQIKTAENKIVNQFEKIKDLMHLNEKRIIVYSPSIIELLGKISGVFSSIVFIQNRIPRLIGRELNISTPASLHRLITNNSKKYKIPAKFFRIFRRYWTKTGKRMKLYRDVEQHHFILTTNIYLSTVPEFRLLVMLPDNPEVKKPEELTYIKEYDAFKFIETSFNNLHICLEELAQELGYNSEKFQPQINLDTMGELREKKGTIAAMINNLQLMRGIIFGFNEGRLLISPFQLKSR